MTISVVIPIYNRGPRVQKTLDSILNQTLVPLEIIVVDDGSTDESADWIEAHYGEQIRVVRQTNGGVARARNRGLQEARSEYIAFCDHDDIWLPRKLEMQWEMARAHPEAALIGCNWRDADEQGETWDDTKRKLLYRDWRPVHGAAYDWICASPCPIISMTLPLLHTERVRAIGGFDPHCVPCDDWDIYLRLAERFPFEWVEEVLAIYVHHPRQQSSALEPLHAAMKRVLRKQWPAILSHPRRVAYWWSFSRFLGSSANYYRAKTALEAGQKTKARREIARVVLSSPLALFSKQWFYLMLRLARGQFGSY